VPAGRGAVSRVVKSAENGFSSSASCQGTPPNTITELRSAFAFIKSAAVVSPASDISEGHGVNPIRNGRDASGAKASAARKESMPLHRNTKISRPGPWTPRTKTPSMSAVRLGPVMMTALRPIPAAKVSSNVATIRSRGTIT
jgi:hypothetical protein